MAAIFAVSVLLPLAVWWRRDRRASEIRRGLDLIEPSRRAKAPIVVAIAAVPLLLGAAAAQPVIGTTRKVPERTDAEAFFVMDTSRSMLAAAGPSAPERFQRARDVALELRDRIPEVPSGLVSMTDRLLPHVLPTTDRRVFFATLTRSMDVELPPPAFTYNTQATSYDLLGGIPERHYFAPSAKKRLLVVLTDGESRPVTGDLGRQFDVDPPIRTVFVRFWNENERIYAAGVPEGPYRPLANSRVTLDRVAGEIGGKVYEESGVSAAANEIEAIVGDGETGSREISGARLALMPWVALAACLPLAFLLWQRNR